MKFKASLNYEMISKQTKKIPKTKQQKKKRRKKPQKDMKKKLTTLNSIRNITFSLLGLNKNLMVLTEKWNLAGNYCLSHGL